MRRGIAAVLTAAEKTADAFACAVLFSVAALTVFDVFGRYCLNAPIHGATELTEFGIALVVFAALPAVTWNQKHIAVDLLDRFFPPRARRWREIFLDAVFAFCLAALANRILQLGARSAKREEVSEYLSIPVALIYYCIAASCAAVALGLLLRHFVRAPESRPGPPQ